MRLGLDYAISINNNRRRQIGNPPPPIRAVE